MGNTLIKTSRNQAANHQEIDLDDVITVDQFDELVRDVNGAKRLNRQMMKEKRGCKIYIARRTCEYDETEPEIIEEYETDYILSQYKYQYYIAEITFEQTGEPPSFANILWNELDSSLSYSFNIYCLHKKYESFKSCVVLKYWTPERTSRTKKYGYSMAEDLTNIAQYLKTLTNVEIEERQLEELSSKEKRDMYEKINKKQKGIYEKICK